MNTLIFRSPASMTDLEGLFKTAFVGEINSAIEDACVLMKQLKPTSRYVMSGSKDIKHAVELVRATSLGFRGGSSEQLPTTAPSDVKQASSAITTLYAYHEFYGDLLRTTMSNIGSFAEGFKQDIDSLSMSCGIEVNRAGFLDGSGKLGEVGALSSTGTGTNNTITVRKDATYTTVAPNMKWFEKGMYIDIYDPTGVTHRNSAGALRIGIRNVGTRALSIVTSAAADVQLDAVAGPIASAVQVGDIIVIQGNLNKEPDGLDSIIGTGTFNGIAGATYDRWNSYVDTTGAARALTLDMVQNALNEIETYGKDLLVMTTQAIRDKFVKLVKADNSLTLQTAELKGGWKTVSYNGYPIWADIYAPYGNMYFVNTTKVVPHMLDKSKDNIFNPFKFDDLDGKVLHATRGYDLYWAKGVMNYQMTTTQRNAHAKITDIDATL